MHSISDLIKAGDLAGLRDLLDHNPEVLNAEVEGAPSALLLAVYYGKPAVVDLIRQYRPKFDVFESAATGDRHQLAAILALDPTAHTQVSSDGFTPLGYAAYFGHHEVAKDLVAAGADPSVRSQNSFGVSPLHSALAGGHKELARAFIESGADVNAPSVSGWTPLHYAAHSGDIETTRYLLARGAQTNVVDSDGKTPAALAQESGHTDLATLLTQP